MIWASPFLRGTVDLRARGPRPKLRLRSVCNAGVCRSGAGFHGRKDGWRQSDAVVLGAFATRFGRESSPGAAVRRGGLSTTADGRGWLRVRRCCRVPSGCHDDGDAAHDSRGSIRTTDATDCGPCCDGKRRAGRIEAREPICPAGYRRRKRRVLEAAPSGTCGDGLVLSGVGSRLVRCQWVSVLVPRPGEE